MLNTKTMLQNPILLTDGYKLCHIDQYPAGVEHVYETWTPRMSRIEGITHVVFFGLQAALAEITDNFNTHFFNLNIDDIIEEYDFVMTNLFKYSNKQLSEEFSSQHIRDLHALGYLPLEVKALQEGTFTPIGVPMFTLMNTHPNFGWLPGYLESQLSSYIWSPMVAATIADKYKRILNHYAEKTSNISLVEKQAGDFSMRGMSAPESSMRTGGGHLLSFGVSATVATLPYLMEYYGATRDTVAYTPATEHSVMCSYGEDELHAFEHMMTNVYPSGNFSIVSDTYDLWNVVDTVLPELKDVIMARDGKVVIRPDSGEPIDILCGDKNSDNPTVQKGIVERLFEIFGGTINEKGYKVLDPHIGVVYGDSITPERTLAICEKLEAKGFATTNVILGIGSYTYQYNTRDTFGFALKATAEIANGEFKMIQKRPATDTGNFKKSQKGMVRVEFKDNDYVMVDGLTPSDIEEGQDKDCLEVVYKDGQFVQTQNFEMMRWLVAIESDRVYKGGF